jgi:hypothetical protein
MALGRELREAQASDPKAREEARKILFGQRVLSRPDSAATLLLKIA